MPSLRPRGLEKILIGGLLAVLAAIPWAFRENISRQFASSYLATIDVRTTTERDDKRVARAFASAAAAASVDATIDYPQGKTGLIRKSAVHVRGASRDAALAAAKQLSGALESAFNDQGSGRLDTYTSAWVAPIAGDTSIAVARAIGWGSGIVGFGALGLLVAGWRESRRQQPAARLFELPATLALIVIAVGLGPLLLPRWVFMALFAMAIPCAIAARIVGKAREAQRAAIWPSTEGRIVASKALVEYTYAVGGAEYRGYRVGIGDLSVKTTRAKAARKRYPVGHLCPVYYDPANPADSLLDREPPAPVAKMYAGAALTVLVSLVVVIALSQIGAIIGYFSSP